MQSQHPPPSSGAQASGWPGSSNSSSNGVDQTQGDRDTFPTRSSSIKIPSLASFRAGAGSLLKRSVDNTAPSSLARSASVISPQTERSLDGSVRPSSFDQSRPRQGSWYREDGEDSPDFRPRNLDYHPHGDTPAHQRPSTISASGYSPIDDSTTPRQHHRGRSSQNSQNSQGTPHALITQPRLVDRSSTLSYHTAYDSASDYDRRQSQLAAYHSRSSTRSSTMSSQGATPRPPDLVTFQAGGSRYNQSLGPQSPQELRGLQTRRSESPRIANLFGWRRGSNAQAESPTTTFSDGISMSPGRSPLAAPPQPLASSPIHGDGDDYFSGHGSYYDPASPMREGPHVIAHVDELLKELREVSAELAASIRREMELEDEVDLRKTEMPTGPIEHSRRTSDYYSDSGASSIRLPLADSETKMQGLEKMRRKAEQEKAQLRLEISQKAQDDLNQKRALEIHVQSLEEQIQIQSAADGERNNEHFKDLESALEDLKRRLNEERKSKENLEDLLAGMREEVEAHRLERDNLRDEVTPQLRARIEGLESQAAEMQNLAYENTRLQQESQGLKNENQTLVNARRMQMDLQQQNPRFRTIAEEDDQPVMPKSPTLSSSPTMGQIGFQRSNSLARNRSVRHRSDSKSGTKDSVTPVESHSDSFKDVEDQRDALHRTLKNLILRHDSQTKENAKRLRTLEAERDNALSGTPRRAAFHVEVQNLRGEINHLRRRADDALEQKWQCEKGLSGLKMDLDRAQQETTSLRELLLENDIFVPDQTGKPEDLEASDSLHSAYAELQNTHASSLARLQSRAEADGDENTASIVESSSERLQNLSQEVEAQLATNAALRSRLGDAIKRGVAEQQTSAQKITDLETALRAAEENVVAATSVSEDAIAKQEVYVKAIREAAGEQSRRGVVKSLVKLQSMDGALNSAIAAWPPMSPALKSPLFDVKRPKLGRTTSGKGVGVTDASRTEVLEGRVSELEAAAMSADQEMQGVVEKMNRAQIEVAELQTERDEALRQTRRLQREVLAERERVKALAA